MRELSFKGFLSEYIKNLSEAGTKSLYKLVKEIQGGNLRLREPLVLYALYSDKGNLLIKASNGTSLCKEYSDLIDKFDKKEMTKLFEEKSPLLSDEYRKVWNSFCVQKNRLNYDNQTKELMRQKVKRLQENKGVTNYRIYADLKLNPGNINAWLKHGESDKVSLETARLVLNYLEN